MPHTDSHLVLPGEVAKQLPLGTVLALHHHEDVRERGDEEGEVGT
jgi:hypothetical protein